MKGPRFRNGRYAALKPQPVYKAASLRTAHGPGSIHAEAELRHLIADGDKQAAAAFHDAHYRILGVAPLSKRVQALYQKLVAGA